MAENFIRVRGGLEFFSVREQILDTLRADNLDEVLVCGQLGAVLRDYKRGGIFARVRLAIALTQSTMSRR